MSQKKDLQELLRTSSSTRTHFLSQNMGTQLALHQMGTHIHSAQDLHRFLDAYEKGFLLF